jgi:hypothetical protein
MNPAHSRLSDAVAKPVILMAIALTSCIDDGSLAPQCASVIEVEVSSMDIVVGDTFTATASHQVEQCLVDLTWTATGSVDIASAESFSVTVNAIAAGQGTIRVQNRFGDLGIATVDVDEAEGGKTSAATLQDRRARIPLD